MNTKSNSATQNKRNALRENLKRRKTQLRSIKSEADCSVKPRQQAIKPASQRQDEAT